MSSFEWMYFMASFVTISIALIAVLAYGSTMVSNKQKQGLHLVDTMAGDEGED